MNIPIDTVWVEADALAGVRVAAFIAIAPPFSYRSFPVMVKAIVAVGLALAVAPVVTAGYRALEPGQYLIQLVTQALIGAALGFLVYLIFAAVQSAGSLIDVFGGFQIAQAFDPGMSINGAQFTRLFQMTALALMFASDAYQLVVASLADTFSVLPVDANFSLTVPVHMMMEGLGRMFLDAVQFAGPLLLVLFLAEAGLGLLTRVTPALHAFTMSYPIKILIVLALGSLTFVALPAFVAALTSNAVAALVAS